jgi:PEP-CTERM motif
MRKLFVALLACLLTIAAAPARAVPLLDLLNGQSLTAGDKLFSDWTLVHLISTDPAADPDLALIDVTPLHDEVNPGLQFTANGQLSVLGANFIDLQLGFVVETLDAQPKIVGNSLLLQDATFTGDGGNVTLVTTAVGGGGNVLPDVTVTTDNLLGASTLFAATVFPAESGLFVSTNLLVTGDFETDAVSLNTWQQRSAEVPEPGTLALLAAGIAGVATRVRSRRRP